MAIPPTIAPTNANTGKSPVTIATTAGPGQKPDSPQPTPKSAAPPSKRPSRAVLVGNANPSASRGCGRPKIRRKAGMVTSSAPPMTNIRVGSHSPATSRKPVILAGLVIPETASPTPKSAPTNKATIILGMPGASSDHVSGKEHDYDRHAEEHR